MLHVRRLFLYSIIIIHTLLCVSRTLAIIDGYSAPIRLLIHSNTTRIFENAPNKYQNVCIGKDWYRFPSHFLLPEK